MGKNDPYEVDNRDNSLSEEWKTKKVLLLGYIHNRIRCSIPISQSAVGYFPSLSHSSSTFRSSHEALSNGQLYHDCVKMKICKMARYLFYFFKTYAPPSIDFLLSIFIHVNSVDVSWLSRRLFQFLYKIIYLNRNKNSLNFL